MIRAPSSSTCRLVSSTQTVTCRPARAGPSQTCCPPIHKFPDAGTTRSTSTAAGDACCPVRGAAAGRLGRWRPGCSGCRGLAAVSWAGTRSGSGEDAGANRLAGKAMPSDWCGRSVLYSCRQASSAACSASSAANGPCTSSSSRCRVWCSRSIFPVVVGEWGLVSRWVMPFSRQIRSNSTSAGRGLEEPAGEHLAVVGQHFLGHPVDAHRVHERPAHRPGGGPHAPPWR